MTLLTFGVVAALVLVGVVLVVIARAVRRRSRAAASAPPPVERLAPLPRPPVPPRHAQALRPPTVRMTARPEPDAPPWPRADAAAQDWITPLLLVDAAMTSPATPDVTAPVSVDVTPAVVDTGFTESFSGGGSGGAGTDVPFDPAS